MKLATTLALALALVLHAANAGAAGDKAPPSKAISADMIERLDAELDRSMKDLSLPGEPPPYFMAFKLTEVRVNDVASSLGAPLAVKERHFMNLDASVRVGDYKFDNTNFVITRQESVDGFASITLPLEAKPKIAAKAAWLATDAAFKEAVAQYTAKKANLQRKATTGTTADSYTKEPPLVRMDPIEVVELETVDDLRKRADEVSNVFRDNATIRESRVAYTSFLERRWYFNTEGTRAHDVRRVTGVIIVATTLAEDGELLSLVGSHYGRTLTDLPSVDALSKEAATIAKTLDAMRKAPVLGKYSGPVLFEGAGAAGIVRHSLSHQLSGTPIPDGLPDSQTFGGELADRIGLRATAPLLSVYDDPTVSKAGKKALIGGFFFDDEGVRAKRVDVIKNGKLATLLMSRTPSPEIAHSNGHARRQGPGMFYGSTTNLFVTGKRGKSPKQLRKALLEEVKNQGVDYGVIVKRFDAPVITANGEIGPRELNDELKGRKGDELPAVLLAYRIYPDGKEELVRGVQLKPVAARAWRDVVAVGKKKHVHNYLATIDDGTIARFRGGGTGYVPSAGVESSVVTPDLLFRELDVQRTPASLIPPPAVPAP
jgi:predicted Zn-dependent protease